MFVCLSVVFASFCNRFPPPRPVTSLESIPTKLGPDESCCSSRDLWHLVLINEGCFSLPVEWIATQEVRCEVCVSWLLNPSASFRRGEARKPVQTRKLIAGRVDA